MKVLLAAGGSGGHIFPAMAVWEKLNASGVTEISMIASKRELDKNILSASGKKAFFLSVNPMPLNRSPLSWIKFAFKFTSDMLKAMALILRLRCDRVVGFGGYSSGAIVVAARVLGRKVLIHEQNYVPGRANRLLARSCDTLALSFEHSEKFFPATRAEKVLTGNPLRDNVLAGKREKALLNLGLSNERITILVMGGSQGAGFLNRTVSGGIALASEKSDLQIQVVHLTGRADRAEVEAFYGKKEIPGRVVSFLDRIEDAYAAADMAFSRSGASALFELAYYSVPMVLIPYPHSMNNQRHNARFFRDEGAAVLEEEKSLSEERVGEMLLDLLGDPEKMSSMASSAKALSRPDAAAQVAAEIMEL